VCNWGKQTVAPALVCLTPVNSHEPPHRQRPSDKSTTLPCLWTIPSISCAAGTRLSCCALATATTQQALNCALATADKQTGRGPVGGKQCQNERCAMACCTKRRSRSSLLVDSNTHHFLTNQLRSRQPPSVQIGSCRAHGLHLIY
jgi:hypothetical protein